MSQDIDTRRKRLLYLATYRGFKEADLLIGGFAKAHLGEMDEGELDQFEALLKQNDRELYAWATGNAAAPANLEGTVLDKLKAFEIPRG
ncbi:succinate dehydrogenase assembly factor 2 [Hyphococcus luteus]|uniref:FAD assembly factor SdhE n=1 Tax=Hyphococcus luteus TaxID=2058213 RepID=A0A2S7JYM5_9PROT|nr:succinate dehydrogenase assembly factor 2 [Marinicaulis flavus]PQA85349.1 succinate dehydrogenase assembly factor 2 [Marinicaulis flavus]